MRDVESASDYDYYLLRFWHCKPNMFKKLTCLGIYYTIILFVVAFGAFGIEIYGFFSTDGQEYWISATTLWIIAIILVLSIPLIRMVIFADRQIRKHELSQAMYIFLAHWSNPYCYIFKKRERNPT